MENLELVITATSGAIALLTAIFALLKRLLIALRGKKFLEDTQKLTNIVLSLIEQAEKKGLESGVSKKEFVVEKSLQFACEHGIECTLEWLEQKIEQLVAFSKTVNRRKKDITKTKQNDSSYCD